MCPIIRWSFICFFRVGLAGALASFVGCSVDGSGAQSSPLQWPGDTWKTASPESQGMSSELLEQARRYAFAEGRNTQSLLVVRNGVIVGEWYADDCSEVTPATSWSTAKSVVSALIGIAVERGEIANIDIPVSTYIPQWGGNDNEVVTIRALLEMRSGFAPIPGPAALYQQSDQLSAST